MTSNFYYYGRSHFRGGISISRFPHKHVTVDKTYLPLAPSKELFIGYKNGSITNREYIEKFNVQLDLLDPIEVFGDLLYLAGGIEPVLLCHCGRDKFCHRHLVAVWLEKHIDVLILEYGTITTDRLLGKIKNIGDH